MRNCCKYLLFCLIILFFSCNQGKTQIYAKPLQVAVDTVSNRILGDPKKGVYVINDTIDLGNRKCTVPDGVVLHFKGGAIKNGTLEGNKTKLKCTQGCFHRVRILGSWDIGTIKSSYFSDLSYDNALKDVVALSDSTVKNKIIIDKGEYYVTAYKNGDICIPVYSNTELVLNGTIRLTPNGYTNYCIIQAEGKNIIIKGKGTIVGDKHTHTGQKGEWGMGINLDRAHHVTINGLTVKDCWGDCIYVGGESSDVRIENCLLDHGRRQGISITSADGVTIKNCTITNVGGTAPEYAIDVEPNKDETIDNVSIRNVKVSGCRGGILAWGGAPNAHIGNLEIRDCTISKTSKLPISIIKCTSAKVENCITKGFSWKKDINVVETGTVVLKNNKKR